VGTAGSHLETVTVTVTGAGGSQKIAIGEQSAALNCRVEEILTTALDQLVTLSNDNGHNGGNDSEKLVAEHVDDEEEVGRWMEMKKMLGSMQC
jgi:hypothetical protein